MARFIAALAHKHPQLPTATRERWAHCYGGRVDQLLGSASAASGLGVEVAPGLYEAELQHLFQHEWARSADDVLWRRTKLGLHYSPAQREQVARWWAVHHPDKQPHHAVEAPCN